MAINKKLIHFKKYSDFNSKKLSANEANTQYTVGIGGTISNGSPDILYQSICWIKDVQKMWTHGTLYDCSEGGATITETDIVNMGFTKNEGTITEVKMNGVSKGTSGVVDLGDVPTKEEFNDHTEMIITLDEDVAALYNKKQDTISDLETIRKNANKGATAVQTYVVPFDVGNLLSGDTIREIHTYELKTAINEHKLILIPFDMGSPIFGYVPMSAWVEDAIYFSVLVDAYIIHGTIDLNSEEIYASDIKIIEPELKQDALVSGENIKTINGESILGSGRINIITPYLIEEFTLNDLWNLWETGVYSTQYSEAAYIAGAVDDGRPICIQSGHAGSKDNIVAISSIIDDAVYVTFIDGYSDKFYHLSIDYYSRSVDFYIQDFSIWALAELNSVAKKGTFGLKIPSGKIEADGYTYALPNSDDGDEDDVIATRGTLKTINGQSIMGTGDIEIGGGSSSGGNGAYSEVNHGTSDTTFTLTSNTFHVWEEVTSLELTFGDETSGVANEYLFQFTSGSTPTVLALPDDIKWADELAIEPNMIYQVSVLKGLATVLEFDNTPKVTLINFTVDSTSFEAESGMLWSEWVGSKYNTSGYISIEQNKVKHAYTGGNLFTTSGATVNSSDAVQPIKYTFTNPWA